MRAAGTTSSHAPQRARVLVAEDEPIIALDMACAIEEAGGEVVGPAASVKQALSLVGCGQVEAAILDVDLLDGDVGPVIEELARRGIPVIVHSGGGLPEAIKNCHASLEVFRKPTTPSYMVQRLLGRIRH